MPNLPASAKLGRNSIRCLDKHKTSAEQNNFVSCAGKEQSHSAGDEAVCAGKHKQRGNKSVFSHLGGINMIMCCPILKEKNKQKQFGRRRRTLRRI